MAVNLRLHAKIADDVQTLRRKFIEGCVHLFKVAPADVDATIFTRYIFAQLATVSPPLQHPIFCNPDIAITTDVIRREICALMFAERDFRKNSSIGQARKIYEIVTARFEAFDAEAAEFRVAVADLDRAKSLSELRQLIDGPIAATVEFLRAGVHEVCDKLCSGIVKFVRAAAASWSVMVEAEFEQQGLVLPGNVLPAYSSGALKVAKDDKGLVVLTWGKQPPIRLEPATFEKLQRLYKAASPDKSRWMYDAIYALCLRYELFFGPADQSFHAAALPATFDVLRKRFGVTQELYAQPFNCHFDRFCSAFPDIDAFFGSVGRNRSFLATVTAGSYEVGPPYTEEVMDVMIDDLTAALERSGDAPLSFVVFVPDWREPLQRCQEVMESANFAWRRGMFTLEPSTYRYANGCGKAKTIDFPFRTAVYILQNDAAAAKWPYSLAVRDEILASMRAKK